jgi:NAD(P)-dependent dehydrogenase (short-subunit alcohol dehydrogenase family)
MDQGKYAVIGGSSGIGRALVATLASGGHRVWAGSRSGSGVQFEDGVSSFTWDAATGDMPENVLPENLQGLVYCPGTIKLAPFARLSPDRFIEDFQVNVVGAVRAVQACLPALKRSERGASVVLFSTVAVQTGMPFHASIATAKGAVEGLARSLAAELAPRIRVNAIAPSLTDTPLARQLLSSESKRNASEERHPLKRVGRPGDIASLAAYLLGDDASWISGQVLHVDGGMSALRTFS